MSIYHESGSSDDVLEAFTLADAETLREDRFVGPFKVTIGDVDLPAVFSNGQLNVQASLPLLFQAFAEDLPAFLRDMEVRISDKRGRAFSLNCDGRPVLVEGLAEPRVVSGRRFGR